MTLWSIYFVPLFSSPLKWNSCNPVQQGSLQIPNKIKNVGAREKVYCAWKTVPCCGRAARAGGKRGSDNGIKRENNMALLSSSTHGKKTTREKQDDTRDKNSSSFYAFLSGIRRIPNYKIMRRRF
jgi:hypothetical protein